ncbi:MAG: peptidyl-tRNA hydrolase Pth2 [Promethearchaeota archaeon]
MFKFKQVVVVRTDIKMGTGKKCAQACHASVSASERARIDTPRVWKAWYHEGQRKIVLKAADLETLIRLRDHAKREKLPFFLVADAGLTQLEPGTVTALGIGPADEKKIDKVSGHLKLL